MMSGMGEGPKLVAGFTMLAEHLRDRLDCLLHGVVCEEPAYKALEEVSFNLSVLFSAQFPKTGVNR